MTPDALTLISSRLTWAVWLGANTAKRLAAEWEIPRHTATKWLHIANRGGLLRVRMPARGKLPTVYRVARLEVGMTDRSMDGIGGKKLQQNTET